MADPPIHLISIGAPFAPFLLAAEPLGSNGFHGWLHSVTFSYFSLCVTPRVQNCLYGPAPHVEQACIHVAPRLHFRHRFV